MWRKPPHTPYDYIIHKYDRFDYLLILLKLITCVLSFHVSEVFTGLCLVNIPYPCDGSSKFQVPCQGVARVQGAWISDKNYLRTQALLPGTGEAKFEQSE